MNVAVIVSALNLVLTFLALATLGRIVRESNDNMDVLVQGHNFQIAKLRDLTDALESALDCLVSLDAKAAGESSGAEVHE